MQGASDRAAALNSTVLTDRRQVLMQFFLTDLALTFTGLLGYRALQVARQHRAPVALLPQRASRQLDSSKAVKPRADLSHSPRHRDVPRAPLHRLINFW